MRGGLAVATTWACAGFGAITGMSVSAIVVMAQALQVATKEVWVIGDGPQDINAAHAAGAKAIAIAGGFNTKAMVMEAHPDAYFESLDAFVDALPPRVSVRWRFEA